MNSVTELSSEGLSVLRNNQRYILWQVSFLTGFTSRQHQKLALW